MSGFIDLSRRFRDLTREELERSELLVSLGEPWRSEYSVGWGALLERQRVVILAEAGAGKTAEMRAQAQRLWREDQFALFVSIESLERDALPALLPSAEMRRLEAWKEGGQEPGWFFLDAVDELKLRHGSLDRALRRLAKEIDGHAHRARIFVSCRPTDWRHLADLDTMRERLPTPRPSLLPATPASGEELFLAALKQGRDRDMGTVEGTRAEDAIPDVSIVGLVPLTDEQIRLYLDQCSVTNVAALMEEIDRKNAWSFARRPLDLEDIAAIWRGRGQLGTRAEQHEANVRAKLRDSPDRADAAVLADDKARSGAELIALAVALTKIGIIRVPEQPSHRDEGEIGLDAAVLLPEWTEAQRNALLRRALFDPSTYGRVRFHHRSIQEYLAARCLKAMLDRGMAHAALDQLLFARRYDQDVVIPSMRPIAGWLALWDDHTRRELARREPEALISEGDPASLSVEARIQLTRTFVATYEQGARRGLNLPLDGVRRLAGPELAPTIRELWRSGTANDDVRELLIEMIWQGRVAECVDLAKAAALDTKWEPYHRIAALRAIVTCGRREDARDVADAILVDPAAWPGEFLVGVVGDLFPQILSVDELITIVERAPEPRRAVTGFAYELRRVVERIDPRSETAINLRNKTIDLILDNLDGEPSFHRISSRFDNLVSVLAVLCMRQLEQSEYTTPDVALIRACVVAAHVGTDHYDRKDTVDRLKQSLAARRHLRSPTFWAQLAFMDEVVPHPDSWRRFRHALQDGGLDALDDTDRPWLLDALRDVERPERREVALQALVWLWRQAGRPTKGLEEIEVAVAGYIELESLLATGTAPPQRNRELERAERQLRQAEQAKRAQETRRDQNWAAWRRELMADPELAFSEPKVSDTVENLFRWLRYARRGRNQYNVWDADLLERAFSGDVARRAAAAFQDRWRTAQPVLWSARPPDERNRIPYKWIHGLCGLAVESSVNGWADRLSPDHVLLATTYATLELNGFAPFLEDLACCHPARVAATLGDELAAQLSIGDEHAHLPMLQDLLNADRPIKALVVDRLVGAMDAWPAHCSNEAAARWATHLHKVLDILLDGASSDVLSAVAEVCGRRIAAESIGAVGIAWLRGLFLLDAEEATQLFADRLAAYDETTAQAHAVEVFGTVFGERGASIHRIKDPGSRAHTLGVLVRLAHRFIRPEDDVEHHDIYIPGARDRAQDARRSLFSELVETPGFVSFNEILGLTTEPAFAHLADRLRLLARRRAASDAEPVAVSAEEVLALATRLELRAHDRESLFSVLMARLNDLAHEILHDDFSDRRTLRTITDEVEMQRTLARRLRDSARGAYRVTREEEVADGNRTDIRVLAAAGAAKAVIEVKIGDKSRSLSDLERAIREQLVGKYMRDKNCSVGCLLVTYSQSGRHWIHPISQTRLGFQDAISYLQSKCRDIMARRGGEILVTVVGLDLGSA